MRTAAEDARNEPLLPRSASFGSGNSFFDPLYKVPAAVAHLQSNAFHGDELAIKSMCLLGICGQLAVALLSLISPFTLLSPLHLLTCLYLLPLSLCALALEVDVPLLEPFRRWIFYWLRGLTLRFGRGVLYVVFGTLVAGMGGPLELAVGLLDVGAGIACMWASRSSATTSRAQAEADRLSGSSTTDLSDMPRLAFKRRVLYGMERMDSAELVALCLELGVNLDARSRAAALSRLDPQQTGFVEEEAFLAWWDGVVAAGGSPAAMREL